MINYLIEYRICDIEEFYGELEDKLDGRTKEIIDKLIDCRGDEDLIKDKVKLLIFNNRHTINLKN